MQEKPLDMWKHGRLHDFFFWRCHVFRYVYLRRLLLPLRVAYLLLGDVPNETCVVESGKYSGESSLSSSLSSSIVFPFAKRSPDLRSRSRVWVFRHLMVADTCKVKHNSTPPIVESDSDLHLLPSFAFFLFATCSISRFFYMLDAVQISLLSLAGDCVLIMPDTRLLHPLAKSSSMARVILIV